MLGRASHIDFILTPGGEVDALVLEAKMVRQYQPDFNVRLQDDASYPYICVSRQGDLPQLSVKYNRDKLPKGGRAFGPYADREELREVSYPHSAVPRAATSVE